MKKIIYLFISLAFLFTACEKENEIPSNPVVVIIDNPNVHSYSKHLSEGRYNLFNYRFERPMLKSTADTVIAVNDTLKYLNFISYYSEDGVNPEEGHCGQRNIYEIEVYSNGVNVALNIPVNNYEKSVDISQMSLDSMNTMFGIASHGDGDIYPISYVSSFIDGPKEFINDGFIETRWANKRNERYCVDSVKVAVDSLSNDSIFRYYAYAYPDTVNALLNLRKSIKVDSIKLYLGYHKQTFDLQISTDSTKWTQINSMPEVVK